MPNQESGIDSSESLHPARSAVVGAWRNIGFLATLLVLVYCVVGAFDPPRFNWGDSGSSYNVMIAGRNFARYGFIHERLTPVLLDRSVMTPSDTDMVYTHYPQLPELMNGVLRKTFGMTDVVPFRLVALAFSFGSLFFIYGLVSMYWSRQTAQLALAIWVINPMWIQHADYLHHSPYGAFFGFGCMYFLARSFDNGRRRAYLVASGVFLYLTYFSSYDYWIFTPLLLAAMTARHYRAVFAKSVVRTLGFLAAFALLAIVCKVATNIWARGGLDLFLQDLRHQAVEHSTRDKWAWYAPGIWPTTLGRIERVFSLLFYPLIAFWAVFPLLRQRLARGLPSLERPLVNPLLLLLPALPFLYAFAELWVIEYYPALMLLPFYAVGMAGVILLSFESRQRTVRAIGVVVLLAVVANAMDENIRFKKAFFDRDAIRTLRTQLDSLAPPGQRILTNHFLEHPYRYYFDRRLLPLTHQPPFRIEAAMAFWADPTFRQSADSNGAVLVQHKHVTDEMFDKSYGWILWRARMWDAWANPPRYRRFIDSLIVERDSVISVMAARHGKKLYESDFYVLWRIYPMPRRTPGRPAPVSPP